MTRLPFLLRRAGLTARRLDVLPVYDSRRPYGNSVHTTKIVQRGESVTQPQSFLLAACEVCTPWQSKTTGSFLAQSGSSASSLCDFPFHGRTACTSAAQRLRNSARRQRHRWPRYTSKIGAQEGTRTLTPLRAPDSHSGLSTKFQHLGRCVTSILHIIPSNCYKSNCCGRPGRIRTADLNVRSVALLSN